MFLIDSVSLPTFPFLSVTVFPLGEEDGTSVLECPHDN